VVDADSVGKATGSVDLAVTGGTPGYTYSMNNSDFQPETVFTGLSKGDYTFYVRDDAWCINTIEASINEAPEFIANIDSTKNVSCFGLNNGNIALSATGGVGDYTYQISGNGINATQSSNIFWNLAPGIYHVTVSYTGVNTYTADLGEIEITQPSAPLQADITDHIDAICGSTVGQATVTATGGTPEYTYLWDGQEDLNTSTATNLGPGEHSVLVTDANACTSGTSIVLFDPDGPQLVQTGSTPALCFNSVDGGSATLKVSGGTAPFTVYWEELDFQDNVSEYSTASNIAPGNYHAEVTDSTGCTFPLYPVVVPSPAQLFADGDFADPVCHDDANGKIMASGNGGTPPYQYNWLNVPGQESQSTVGDLAAGKYYLQLTDAHNCTSLDSFVLFNPAPIEIDLPDSVFICASQTATLDAENPGAFFQWTSDNGFNSDKQVVYIQDQGSYSVTVTNIQGCNNAKQVYLKYENRQFDAAFLLASQATMNDTIILIEISWPVPDSLEWYIADDFIRLVDGEAYKELMPLETGEYTIGMRAWMEGCEDIVEKTITILPAEEQTDLKSAKTDLIQNAKLYPNPNTGKFEVEVNLASETDVRADLFSIKGMRIIPTKYEKGKKDYLLSFNLMGLEPGIYFVNVAAGNEVKKLKFVVN